MKLNASVFEKISKTKSKILVVTKYYEDTETQNIINQTKNIPCVIGVGENRIPTLEIKNIPREYCHFIGKIQSRAIPLIIKHCSVIHSVENIKHAELINKHVGAQFITPLQKIDIFLQVNISGEPQKSGVTIEDFPQLLVTVLDLKYLNILGISAIGAGEFTRAEKIQEFQKLKALRDIFLPEKIISAGTSRDYEIALEEGIEVVRVGRALTKINSKL